MRVAKGRNIYSIAVAETLANSATDTQIQCYQRIAEGEEKMTALEEKEKELKVALMTWQICAAVGDDEDIAKREFKRIEAEYEQMKKGEK